MTDPAVTLEANQRIDVDALMDRVRQEARARGHSRPAAEDRPNLYLDSIDEATRSASRANRVEVRSSYALTELLDHGDADFLRNAYIAVLRRAPDSGGFEHYLSALRAGAIDRVEVIGRLRYSAEGRAAAVPIAGLRKALAYRQLRRVPVVGYLAVWCNHLLRLPRLAAAVGRTEVDLRTNRHTLEARLEKTERQLAVLSARIDQALENSHHASALSAIAAELSEAALTEPVRAGTSRDDGR